MAVNVASHDWDGKAWDWPLQHNDGIVKVHNDRDLFEVSLDAQFFTPNEIKVKVIDGMVDVVCEHESRTDQFGDVSRTVHRTYKLPDDVDFSTVKSSLSGRGMLTITAGKKK